MKRILIIKIVVWIVNGVSFGQSFEWELDGYLPHKGGGFFSNVDNSGISLTISGIATLGRFSEDPACARAGINNMRDDSVVHKYEFIFSSPANVTFTITKINAGPPCYNDKLGFSGNPIFSLTKLVRISSNQVFPLVEDPQEGEVTITYHDTSSFTIFHGTGEGCNPGYIQICKLDFEPTRLPILKMPNVFTPNGDRYNSHFKPVLQKNITRFRIEIFNRWGKLVYRNGGLSPGWDGQDQPNGIYYWIVRFDELDSHQNQQKGWVQLLR